MEVNPNVGSGLQQRAMSRSAVVLRNAASNWSGVAVNAIVLFLLTPFILREIGTTRYGIWVLTSSIIGYYGMLDLGFRAGINQYLTRSLALSDLRQASGVLSTAVVALSVLGLVMVLLSIGAAVLAPRIFGLPAEVVHEAFWCIMIVGATASIQCVLSPFSAIFVAVQRFDLSNLIGISSRILTALGIVIALKLDSGLIGVAAATGAGTVVDYLVRWRVAVTLVPGLKVTRREASMEHVRRVGSFGLWNFLISISSYVYLHMQPLLIAAFLPVSAIAHYALAAGVWYQINGLFTPLGQVLYPAAAALDAQGDRSALNQVFRDGSRLLLLAVIPTALIAFVWANDFYRLWIGPEYLSGEPYVSVAFLLKVLLLGTVLSYFSNVAGQILMASGHVRQLALIQVSGAILNLTISLLLIQHLGLLGLAIGSVLAVVLVDVLGVPIALRRLTGMNVGKLVRDAWGYLSLLCATLVFVFLAIRRASPPDTWRALLLNGLLAGCAAIIAVIALGLTAEERHRFIERPVRRFLKNPVWRRT